MSSNRQPQISIRVPAEVLEKYKEIAQKEARSISNAMTKALEEYLKIKEAKKTN